MKQLTRILMTALGVLTLLGAGMAVANAGQREGPHTGATSHDRPAAPGRFFTPTHLDDVYVSITPCRLFDTRAAGGAITNSERTFAYFGHLNAQGGATDCGIPFTASAVALNLTAISAGGTGSGSVLIRPANGPVATTTLLNFSPAVPVSNHVNQPVNWGGMSLRVIGSAQLIGDAQGYYEHQMDGLVGPDGTILKGTPSILATHHNGTGSYEVRFDRDVNQCAPTITPYLKDVYGQANAESGGWISVNIWSLVKGVETPIDTSFFAKVAC